MERQQCDIHKYYILQRMFHLKKTIFQKELVDLIFVIKSRERNHFLVNRMYATQFSGRNLSFADCLMVKRFFETGNVE